MAKILAYTSPALGHALPISALLSELSGRGHEVRLRTLSAGVEIGKRLGFSTDTIDPRIEGIEHDDWKASNPAAGLKRAFAVLGRRAPLEVADLTDAIARVDPDALLIEELSLRRVGSMDEFWRRAPLMLVASGKPFQYPHTDWGDAVQMIGPCPLDPGPNTIPDWLSAIELPIVLVTTSSEK